MRDASWEDIFKLSASAAAIEFCEWFQVGIDVYIPHRKYQVKPHLSPWCSAACTAAIVDRNQFFRCTNRINLLSLRSSSDRLVIFAKSLLKLPNFHMLIKKKESITSQKLGSRDFWRIANSIPIKGKSAIPSLFYVPDVLPSAFDKAKLFTEKYFKNSNLVDSGLKLHNISVTPRMVKKVITNLDLSKVFGPDCIQWLF